LCKRGFSPPPPPYIQEYYTNEDVRTDNSGPSDVEYIDGPYGNAP